MDSSKPTSKIIINGKEIGPEKVPELLRQFVTDANQDGIPDFMENFFKNPIFKMIAGKSLENIKSQLQNMKNLTPEQQAKISVLIEKLGAHSGHTANTASMNVSTVVTTGPTSSGYRPQSSAAPIDYKALGIQDPDQKHAPSLGWMVAAVLLGALAVAVWMLMKK